MSASEWFHVVGLISAIALGVGFVAGVISVGLSWRINQDLKAKLAQLQQQASEQQARAATAEAKLLELQERSRPRALTPSEIATLCKALAAIPNKVPVEIVTAEHSERFFPKTEVSQLYGKQLAEIFVRAGWTVSESRGTVPRYGIKLMGFSAHSALRAGESPIPIVGAVQGALWTVELPIQSDCEIDPRYTAPKLRFAVGLDPW
jgi:hypothetical protein